MRDHLGFDPATSSATRERHDENDLPNVQLALNELVASSPGSEVIGLPAELTQFTGFSLSSLVGGRFHGPVATSPVEYLNVPVDVDRTLPCARVALYLVALGDDPVAALVSFGERHGPAPGLNLEVIAADQAVSERFLAAVRRLAERNNVYRGKVLGFSFSEYGAYGLAFHRLPVIERADIVLPDADLRALESHTVGISERADDLRRAGRHLKRGLLLYGPPGTGKTYSVMYLCNRMPGRTTVLLSGPAAGALGQAVALARALQPSMVVLEDVDLIAMERTMPGMGTNPLLYQLLNEMDGLAEDADVIFALTTNRVELLEPALAQRPGRIDQAVEIKLPDAECRRRLLALYLRGIPTGADDHAELVAATEGVSAAFIKELVRRAVLAASEEGRSEVGAGDLSRALTDLLEHSAPVLRTLLGAGPPPPRGDGGWSAFPGDG